MDIERKREVIGSIYPEKLTFDGLALRTTRVNEAIELIYKLDESFSENKNRTKVKKSTLSCDVGLPGFEPRQTESKSVVLPLHNNPIRTQNYRFESANLTYASKTAKSILILAGLMPISC